MKTVSLLGLLGLSLLAVSCNVSPFSSGPGKTLTAALMTANEGKYSEADEYLSSDMKKVVHGDLGALAGGSKGVWDQETRNGTIQRTEAAAFPLASSGPASLAKAAGARDDRMIFRRAGDIELHRHPLILVQEGRHLCRLPTGLRFRRSRSYYTALPYIRSMAGPEALLLAHLYRRKPMKPISVTSRDNKFRHRILHQPNHLLTGHPPWYNDPPSLALYH